MMRLVQVAHPTEGRRVAVVEEGRCSVLPAYGSTYELACGAISQQTGIEELVARGPANQELDYGAIYAGASEWRLLPPVDHPDDPARCLVSGTGLTHKASAANRDAMHTRGTSEPQTLTDSMRIFQQGMEGGKPRPGQIGVQPEWFYKGNGAIVRAHGEGLGVPSFADDGGEEPEVAGIYIIDPDGVPCRLGMAIGNEFADHVMEKKNYLYLAPSKLRDCALGPELVVDPDFQDVSGTVSIERSGQVVWSTSVKTGEANMSHSLANLEHHQFKYAAHRRPGDLHIHFYGADAFSFGDGFPLEDGDTMVVSWDGFGRPLRNPLAVSADPDAFVSVSQL